jgi:release factor glutamine methyltransferase
MTIDLWLTKSIEKLESTSVPTARLDAEVLLADQLNKDRSWIHAHPEFILQRFNLRKLDEQIGRRVNHEPLAYIRGKQEFYGREFSVSPDTLTPRPETEAMIDLLLKTVHSRRLIVDSELQFVDVGTGSGCIIITVALELLQLSTTKNQLSFTGLDISKSALKIAKNNAKNLKADVVFKQFDLLSDKLLSTINSQQSTVIVANLPYVPTDFQINLAATHEPEFAIFGGKDGLDYYRELFSQLSSLSIQNKQITVMTESLPPQHNKLSFIASKLGFKLFETQDLVQVFEKL